MYQGDATGSASGGSSARVRGSRAALARLALGPAHERRRAPRSGNGTSIVSKSRGASVAANTARASSRSSPPA